MHTGVPDEVRDGKKPLQIRFLVPPLQRGNAYRRIGRGSLGIEGLLEVGAFYAFPRWSVGTRKRFTFFMANGKGKMQILYNTKTDLLYLRLDDQRQTVMNKRLSEDIVLDVGEDDRIVGIEILDASKHLNLERLLPVKYEVSG